MYKDILKMFVTKYYNYNYNYNCFKKFPTYTTCTYFQHV